MNKPQWLYVMILIYLVCVKAQQPTIKHTFTSLSISQRPTGYSFPNYALFLDWSIYASQIYMVTYNGTWVSSTINDPSAHNSRCNLIGDSDIYCAGGFYTSPTGVTTRYTTIVRFINGKFSTLSVVLSRGRSGVTIAGPCGDIILFAGGYSNSGYEPTVEVYDKSKGTYQDVLNLSVARNSALGVALGNQCLIAGGYNGTDLKVVDLYNADTDEWSVKSMRYSWDLVYNNGTHALFIGGGIGYEIYSSFTGEFTYYSTPHIPNLVCGAARGNYIAFAVSDDTRSVYFYDFTLNSFFAQRNDLSLARQQFACAAFNDQFLFAGGYANSANSDRVDIYTFSFPSQTPQPDPSQTPQPIDPIPTPQSNPPQPNSNPTIQPIPNPTYPNPPPPTPNPTDPNPPPPTPKYPNPTPQTTGYPSPTEGVNGDNQNNSSSISWSMIFICLGLCVLVVIILAVVAVIVLKRIKGVATIYDNL